MARKLVAYEEFVQSTGELDDLLSVRPASPLARRTDDTLKLENAVHRACLVLLVAHFEGFAKAALREYADEICAMRPPVRNVPAPLLELFTRERIQEIASLSPGVDRVNKTRKLFAGFSNLWDEGRTVDPKLISSKVLARQMTSLRPEVLRESFALIGISDIVDASSVILQASGVSVRVDMKLEEIVDKRNLIAHGDYSVKPTSVELSGYLEFLMAVAEAFSRIVADAIEMACSLRSS